MYLLSWNYEFFGEVRVVQTRIHPVKIEKDIETERVG